MTTRTTIKDESSGSDLHVVDYDAKGNETCVFLHSQSGGFSNCIWLNASEARKMAEALMKAALAIEAAMPEVREA